MLVMGPTAAEQTGTNRVRARMKGVVEKNFLNIIVLLRIEVNMILLCQQAEAAENDCHLLFTPLRAVL